ARERIRHEQRRNEQESEQPERPGERHRGPFVQSRCTWTTTRMPRGTAAVFVARTATAFPSRRVATRTALTCAPLGGRLLRKPTADDHPTSRSFPRQLAVSCLVALR